MKSISEKIPLLVSVIFLGFSCVLFYFLYSQIGKNSAIALENNIKWQEETHRLEEAKMLDRGIKMVEAESVILDTHFGKNSDLVPFLDTIEGLAPQVGATAETTSVDLAPDGLSLIVGLKATGDFASIYKFLRLLENSPYQLEFLSVNFVKESTLVANFGWEAHFKIKLLSFTN